MQSCKKCVLSGHYLSILILFLVFLFSPFFVYAQQQDDDGPGVTIFIYHRFGEDKLPTTNVAEERFREQLAYLLMNNYQVIPLSELVTSIKNKTPLPKKAAVLTIDDGYKSVYEVAWPILQSFGYPFTVFLYVEGVDKKFNDYMTWDQIRELQASGVDFQDHSYSHHHLADKPEGLDDEGYREWIRDDLRKSARILTENLGIKPNLLAIPYGEYNSTVIDVAKDLGYEAIFSQDPGSISLETDTDLIPREPILGNEWSTTAHFEKVLNQVDMPITLMEPPPKPLQNKIVSRFGAGLLYPDRYQKGTMGVYVSGLGWHRAEVDGNFIYIENDKPLQRHVNRVTVSGRDKKSGRLARRTWLLVRPEN